MISAALNEAAAAPDLLSDEEVRAVSWRPLPRADVLSRRWLVGHDVVRLRVPWEVASATWFEPVVGLFEELINLPTGWDSYGGEALTTAAAEEALNLLSAMLKRDSAPPSISPLNGGGVQLEWHRGGLDVDVVLSNDEDRGIHVVDLETGTEWSDSVDEGLRRLRELAGRLALGDSS